MDPKTKLFTTKLVEDLDFVQTKLANRDDLYEQEKDVYYIACKEALAIYNREKWGGLLARGFGQRASSRRKANVLISKRA